jgi:hypothetical protein
MDGSPSRLTKCASKFVYDTTPSALSGSTVPAAFGRLLPFTKGG